MDKKKRITIDGVEYVTSGIVVDSLSNSFAHRPIYHDEYELPPTPIDKYCVDDSGFVPISEALKQLDNVMPANAEQLADYYDFANGKDSGIEIPLGRNPRESSDIAEISTAITNKVKTLVDTAKNVSEQLNVEQSYQNTVNRLNNIGKTE